MYNTVCIILEKSITYKIVSTKFTQNHRYIVLKTKVMDSSSVCKEKLDNQIYYEKQNQLSNQYPPFSRLCEN